MEESSLQNRAVRFCEHTEEHPSRIAGMPKQDWDAACTCAGLREAQRWMDADLAVMHVDQDELEQVKRRWRQSYSQQKVFLIVRVTKGARVAFERAVQHQAWEEAEKSALVLHVRNHEALERDESIREAVLSISPDQARQIYNEEFDSVPEALRRAFEVPGGLSVLPALAVLCQGYLSLQRETEPKIGEAQLRMGWRKELRSVEEQEEMRLRNIVAGPDFWKVLLDDPEDAEGSREALVAVAGREWRTSGGDATAIPEPVLELIAKVGTKITDPTLVAEAYLALAERLGGADAG